jgi:hypothetical protein
MSGWLRGRVFRSSAGFAVGSAAGLSGFWITRLGAWGVFVLIGGLLGVAAAVIFGSFGRSAQLSEIKISVPHLSELRFTVDRESKVVAWKLFIETVTRVSTQPLPMQSGRVREALTSLYGLFQTTREALKSARPSQPVGDSKTVEQLAIMMLNLDLRPFLTRWHPLLRTWEIGNQGVDDGAWPGNETCREELQAVQIRLLEYATGFAGLAGVAHAETMIGGIDRATITVVDR